MNVCILLSQFLTAHTNVPQIPDFQCMKMADVMSPKGYFYPNVHQEFVLRAVL
jgi:hypothetical protein